MKSKLLLVAAASCMALQSTAQLHVSQTRYIGGYRSEQSNRIRSASNHSIIFTGLTTSGTSGGTAPDGDIPQGPVDPDFINIQNLIVGRLDSNLQLEGVKVFGGTQNEQGNDIKQLPDGGYVVLGTTMSTNGDVTGNHTPTGSNTSDMWLLRLDAQCNLLWQHCYGGPGYDGGSSVLQTPDKGFLLLGGATVAGGDVPFVYGSSQYTSDWFLVKTDSMGNLQWSKTLGGTGNEGGGVLLAANNGYYIVGSSTSTDHECVTNTPATGAGQYDFIVMRIDTAGNRLWSERYGGTGAETLCDAIWDNRDSSIVMVGSTNTPGGNPQNTNNSLDEWLVKIDKNGLYQWSTQVGDTADQNNLMGITIDPNGGYVTVCQTEPNLNKPLPPGYLGERDCWVFQFDDSGHVVSNKIMGGVGSDVPGAGVAKTKNGFCIGGYTMSNSFNEGVMLNTRHSLIWTDIFVSELIDSIPPTLAVPLVTLQSKLSLYPNPAQNSVKILLPETHHSGLLSVYDISGKRIFSEAVKADTNELNIDLQSWAKGTYITEWVPRDGQSLRQKLIVY